MALVVLPTSECPRVRLSGVAPKDAGDVLTAMVAMFNTGDLRDLEATVHPEYLDHQGLGGKPIHGTDGFATIVTTTRGGYESLVVTVEDLIEEADRAAGRLRWRGTRPSGERIDHETLEIVRIEGGKAAEHGEGAPSDWPRSS